MREHEECIEALKYVKLKINTIMDVVVPMCVKIVGQKCVFKF